VLAHELGHFKRRHIVKRIAALFALSLVFLWLLGQLANAAWFYAGLGAEHVHVRMQAPATPSRKSESSAGDGPH